MIKLVGLIAAIILPLWNIPLIARIIIRRSSKDISIFWAMGVWICLILMAPSAFASQDIIWKVFNIINFILFSAVVLIVLIYRREK